MRRFRDVYQCFFSFSQCIVDLDDLPILPLHSSFCCRVDTGKEKISTHVAIFIHTGHKRIVFIRIKGYNKFAFLHLPNSMPAIGEEDILSPPVRIKSFFYGEFFLNFSSISLRLSLGSILILYSGERENPLLSEISMLSERTRYVTASLFFGCRRLCPPGFLRLLSPTQQELLCERRML